MINYKHLHYFWVVAKQGSISSASERLHITPQTISGQISLLEQDLGSALFVKAGRGLELTATGRLVARMADDIFSLGQSLEAAVRQQAALGEQQLRIGITDVVPKSIAYQLLEPLLSENVRLLCVENSLRELLAELALNRLDIVLADAPIPDGLGVKGYSHLLGETGVSFLAHRQLTETIDEPFPAMLGYLPLLIPSARNLVQSRLLQWFDSLQIQPRIVGEFDDSALMKAFGQAGKGAFIAPSAIANQVAKQFNVEIFGATEQVQEQFYMITSERKISNPNVQSMLLSARSWLVPAA